jgi:hypothetical protein
VRSEPDVVCPMQLLFGTLLRLKTLGGSRFFAGKTLASELLVLQHLSNGERSFPLPRWLFFLPRGRELSFVRLPRIIIPFSLREVARP